MTYVSKKEKVFDLPEQDGDSTVSLGTEETKLKRFPSVSDRRAWTREENQRYQHLYGLVNGSEANISKSSSFKYIPFDVLLAILMAEKDAVIQELLERQEDIRTCGGRASVVNITVFDQFKMTVDSPRTLQKRDLYKSEGFEDSDDDRDALIRKDAEVVSLKNKISGLESELEDYRDTLTKAMHKLESMDAVMTENNFLKEKIKYSEETIKYLEGRKEQLEKELEYYRNTYDAPTDLTSKEKHLEKIRHWDSGDNEQIIRLSSERDILIKQVEELQKELEVARTNAAEIEILRKISETTSSSLDEMSKENECYKKKLESMKCLEKHIEELKKQAHTLTEKYKKESQKANEQMKQINVNTKELHVLREERDKLQSRVTELVVYETQYLSLKSKLHQVDLIIDENEILNKKLIQLDRLELENEQLKMRIDQLRNAEVQAAEDKERMLQLQCAVVEQEEEMKRMMRHIEELSRDYTGMNELHRLRNELDEKNGKLKKYEKQLDDIPVLESEIDLLKNKLQKCIDDFKSDKDLLRRLQEELEACRKRCHELEEMAPLCQPESIPSIKNETWGDGAPPEELKKEPEEEEEKLEYEEKGENTVNIPTEDTESQTQEIKHVDKSTMIMDETVGRLQIVEEQNLYLKSEVASLTLKLSKIDLDELLAQTNELKKVLKAKDDKICKLDSELTSIRREMKHYETIKQNLEEEVELLKERTGFMKQELDLKHDHIKEMQESLELERKGGEFARNMIKGLEEKLEEEKAKKEVGETMWKLQKEEANVAKQEIYLHFSREVDHLKGIIHMSKELNRELETENEILWEMKEYLDKTENGALRGLIVRLRAEVRVLKSLSKPELEGECEALQQQVKKLLKDTDFLIDEINELKMALDSEKSVKDFLEKEVKNLQAQLTACITSGNEVLGREMSQKEVLIADLREELARVKSDFQNSVNESKMLKDQKEKLLENANSLESERKELKDQINMLQSREDELRKTINELQEREKECLERTKNFEEVSAALENLQKELAAGKEFADSLQEKIKVMEETIRVTEGRLKEIEENLKLKEESLKEKDENLKVKDESLKAKDESLKEKDESLKAKDESLKEKDESLKAKDESLKAKDESLKEKDESLKAKDESLKEKDASLREKDESLKEKNESLRAKDEELESTRKESLDAANKLKRLRSEMELLKSRLGEDIPEAAVESQDSSHYEKDMEEKYALEEALMKIENELDGLKGKLEECKKMEDEMANLRRKRDSLLEKMSGFENEIDRLKRKLCDFETLKNELVQLKAEKTAVNDDMEVTTLCQELMERKAEIAKLKMENDTLREDLDKTEGLLDVYKSLQKGITEDPGIITGEYYTPPALLSPRSSGPQESIEETLSLETYKKDVKDVELLYEEKIQNLKESSSEKLKKLTEHHEKEDKFRTKAFYESISSIKSSYETDIKKLVDKHKLSIMRLQGLHEDEVQELNTTYETQMEAMQTQNENLINDMRTESAEKFKQQREQHNRDIRDLARKYEELLREKDAQILEKANAEASLNENTNDMKEIHKQAVESLTQFYQNSIVEIEEKHGHEMKKCKKNNLKRIELMKNKYEALLAEERKKYEEQLEEMLLQLKNGQDGDVGKTAEHYVHKKTPASGTRLEFHEILQKIINEGLECLTFEELILVHSKTCFIPENMSEPNAGGGEFSQRFGHGCKHRGLMAAEKEELLKRIFTLEHEIVIKQLETHEAIVNMEAAEICRIQELKNALATAQQKNAELKRLLSDQSKQEMNLKIDRYISDKQANFHETNVMEKVKELEREKAERRRLEEELQKERTTIKNMAVMFEAEKERHKIQRKRDADYVKSIRERLEEALNHEQTMESELDYEVKLRRRLETELENLNRNSSFKSDLLSPPPDIEVKTSKNIKNRDQSEAAKESHHSRSKSRRRSRLKSINNF